MEAAFKAIAFSKKHYNYLLTPLENCSLEQNLHHHA